MIEKISVVAQKEIEKFQKLQLGGKEVCAPYYMNLRKQRGGLRVMVGKGSATEIEQEVLVWAQVKGFDINKATNTQIREFMMQMDIGIDCSGFLYYVLNAELKARGKKSLTHYIKYPKNNIISRIKRTLRPVENIGANLLTSELNCIKIENINDIQPADLIRAKGKQRNAHHVGMITEIQRDIEGNVQFFKYINSHRFYEDQNGIREGKVTITDPDAELKDQKWEDHHNGRNYFLEDLLVEYEDNGLRRLKALI